MKVNHELMESLEYKGEYGARYTCSQCTHCPVANTDFAPCAIQGIDVHWGNNICKAYVPRIKNPSAPEFNFDAYLEFLGSDFYRPYSIDKDVINGSARLGEIKVDGGRLAELLPEVYSPWYKYYDKPYCKSHFKRCYVQYGGVTFHIDYKRFREIRTVENGAIHFDIRVWKDNPRQRKYQSEVKGTYAITEKKAFHEERKEEYHYESSKTI